MGDGATFRLNDKDTNEFVPVVIEMDGDVGRLEKKEDALRDAHLRTIHNPLTIFLAEGGLGVCNANGAVEMQPIYRRIEDHHYQLGPYAVVLANDNEVLAVTPDDWELLTTQLI